MKDSSDDKTLRKKTCELCIRLAVVFAVATSISLTFEIYFDRPWLRLLSATSIAGLAIFGLIAYVLGRGLPKVRSGTYPSHGES